MIPGKLNDYLFSVEKVYGTFHKNNYTNEWSWIVKIIIILILMIFKVAIFSFSIYSKNSHKYTCTTKTYCFYSRPFVQITSSGMWVRVVQLIAKPEKSKHSAIYLTIYQVFQSSGKFKPFDLKFVLQVQPLRQ